MHPVLFRIPLPNRPLMLWWALAVLVAAALVFSAFAFRRGEKREALIGVVVAAVTGVLAYKYQATSWQAAHLPIYSYGVMLGLSLIVGWYFTLTLAEKEGLPSEIMGNCYVITAVSAIVGARLLYVINNLDQFENAQKQIEMAKIFAISGGGLVAYGGFLGGFLGSWAYLAPKKIRLLPWADAAVPGLAAGLFITRIGCYLFGCDYGTRLGDSAPGWLKTLGTFKHWAKGTTVEEGPQVYFRHLTQFKGTALGDTVMQTNASLPVHPTQLYESAVGLMLLALMLFARKRLKFRGQLFFLFTFAYGTIRFLIELLRDDEERGPFGPSLESHILIPGALVLLALGFVFGISLGIQNLRARNIARVFAFAPALVAFILLRPATFGQSTTMQFSTSQWIGLVTGLLVSFFFAQFWELSRRSPAAAMALGDGVESESEGSVHVPKGSDEEDSEEDGDQHGEQDGEQDGDKDAAEGERAPGSDPAPKGEENEKAGKPEEAKRAKEGSGTKKGLSKKGEG